MQCARRRDSTFSNEEALAPNPISP
jgi:hypothetical protein